MNDSRAESDDNLVIAYVCGELDEAERLRLEQRLVAEPSLANRLEQFETMDIVGAALRRQEPVGTATTGGHGLGSKQLLAWLLAPLAAAACVMLLWLLQSQSVTGTMRAIATIDPDELSTYTAALGLPRRLQTSPGEARSSNANAPGASVDEVMQAIEQAERTRQQAMFSAPTGSLTGDFVTLRFTCDTTCSAIAIAIDDNARMRRLYPTPPKMFVFDEVANRFEPGAVHVLPRPTALPNARGTISLHAGFEVNSGSADGATWFLLALREQVVPDALLVELDAELAASNGKRNRVNIEAALTDIDDWLLQHGFTVQRTKVRRR